MLGITSLSALQVYEKHIERLTMMWPRCWGLLCQAEDKARAEHLSKLRRKLLMDFKKGMPMPDDWSEENPWTTCFRMLVVDEEYWNEQVRHPAAAWTASGSRGAPLAPADQIALAHVPGGNEVADAEKEDRPDGKRRQSNRDKRMARAKRQRAERDKSEVKPESDEEQPEHITSSSWRTAPEGNKPERAPERTDEPWTPMRVTQALEASKNFAEFKEKRQFIYVHLFSGATDVLGEAILRLAKLDGMNVEVRSFDRNSSMYAVDLSKEQPFNDILDAARGGLIDGTHAGFPCGSFSRARYNQGHGPPPVRSLECIYGLVTNDERQQKEADVGSLLAIRSIQVTAEVLQTQRKRRVPECGTLENPPGSESQAEGPAWQLPEMLAFLKEFECQLATFNTCAFQAKERTKWFKPGQIGGRLEGLPSLSRKCTCPKYFKHESLVGKALTSTIPHPVGHGDRRDW
eukprot:s307_g20.t1